MPRLTIDQLEIEVSAGTTVLEAAAAAGIEIPNLCWLKECTPQTSCLACVVRINGSQRLVPSCAAVAADGMVVESESDDVRSARRTALELLLSDHAGDCMAPCQGVCPAHLDIPQMIRQIDADDLRAAAITARRALVLPSTLGYICPQLCEKGCRRTHLDSAIAICALHRHAGDYDLARPDPWLPECAAPSGKRVAIVGSGPAGLSAAWDLRLAGHECVIFDQNPQPGGALRYSISPDVLPRNVLDAEIALIARMGTQFRLNTRLGKDVTLDELRRDFDAVLLAIGQVEPNRDARLGVSLAAHGLQADHHTMSTPLDGVFAAGSAVHPLDYAVRAVAQGRDAAHSIRQYLNGEALHPREHAFTSRLGKLSAAELDTFFATADPSPRSQPGSFDATDEQAAAEAHRCMSCDCASLAGCKLRRYAMQYEARPSHYRRPRRHYERITDHPFVDYEPGKCIACGLCVQITQDAGEWLGLTYIGRGFDVRIGTPLDAPLGEALQSTARRCADVCPTGAIQMKRDAGSAI